MPSPASLNFIQTADNACIQGVTFRAVLTLYDNEAGTVISDLTGLSGRVRITDANDTLLWEGTTGGGEVALNVTLATFTVTIHATVTAAFAVGNYHIDIDLINTVANPDEVDRVAHGEFQVVK